MKTCKTCKTCKKELGFSDKINARSYEGNCAGCTTAERNSQKTVALGGKDPKIQEEVEKLKLKLCGESLFVVPKKGSSAGKVQELKLWGSGWFKGGSITLSSEEVLEIFSPFIAGKRLSRV